MPVYSVILPIYNVEAYLPACMESVFAQQTPSSYEVILVDDGSSDGCGALCDAYAAQDARVRVIHQTNQGVSAARNAGLDAARGEFVLFLDPDDLWQPGLLAVMDRFRGSGADMVLFGAHAFDNETGAQRDLRCPILPAGESGEAYLQKMLRAGVLPPVAVWSFLFRRAFLEQNGLRFTAGMVVAEDFDFDFRCYGCAEKLLGTPESLYRYRVYPQSVSQRVSLKKTLQKLQTTLKWYRRYPCAALADSFWYATFSIAEQDGTAQDRAAVRSLLRENRDVYRAVSQRRLKISRALSRAIGFFPASALIMKGIRLRHRVRALLSRR